MIRFRNKRVLVVAVACAALVVFLLPAFVAFRYTAPSQRGDFVRRPWRGWGFAYAALAVPGDAQLKTSGMALRKADWVFKNTAVDPREVQLLYVPAGKPYRFTHSIDGRVVASSAVPSYRFIWQVQGAIDRLGALLDYDTGRVIYDVRDDLLPSELAPEPTSSPLPEPSPSATP
jgi:hypothetical protein